MPNSFQRVGLTAPSFNWFDMNHPVLTSFDIGRLVPKCFNVYAGDRVKIGMEHLIRFQQMYAPVFQRFDVRFDVGYYPFRLVWPEALDFFRGGNSGNTEYPFPTIYAGYIYAAVGYVYLQENSLAKTDTLQGNPFLHSLIDYFNMPTFDILYGKMLDTGTATYSDFFDAVMTKLMSEKPVNILPFVMYQGFFRQWYRNKQVDVNENEDQDWQYGQNQYWKNLRNWTSYLPDIPVYELLNGTSISTFTESAPPTYEYAESRLANIASGDISWIKQLFGVQDVRYTNDYFTSALPSPLMPEVQIPMGKVGFYNSDGQLVSEVAGLSATGIGGSSGTKQVGFTSSNTSGLYNGSLRVDAGTIQQLRQASAMDQYQLRSALGGNGTAQDWILAHYGVKTSDMRLDMPEIIRRVKSFVSISEVTQTSMSTEDSALGEFGGHGISVNNHGLCDYFVEEPGMMFIFMSVVPKQAYFQGMPKLFTRTDRFDFPIPEFAQVGMEPVRTAELFYDGDNDETAVNVETVLGYQDRYAFDKMMLPEIHGDFRTTLSSWHDSRIFDSQPALNSDFIKVSHLQGLDRIFNVTDAKENKLLALLNYHVSIERCLPVYPRYSL